MKKYSLLLLMAIGVLSAQAQSDDVTYTKAHASNYRTWSIGANGGVSMMYGDLISFSGEQNEDIPSGYGKFELGARGHLTKFFNPTMGLRGSIGFYNISGTRDIFYFEGNMIDMSAEVLVNLSNLVIRGKTSDRKNAILLGAGVGLNSSKSYLFSTATGEDTLAESGLVDFAGRGDGGRASQMFIPLTLEYKRKLSNALDLDVGFKYNVLLKDYFDVFQADVTTDAHGYGYIGVTYNFSKDADKQSIIYINPLDEMFGDVEKVANNFEKLTTDDDGDGVNNYFDKESNTPEGVVVDGSGTATDTDQDGIPDYMDEDPFTGKGAKVDAQGRAIDTDGDGVADHMDKEPNTAKGALVNFQGKTIPKGSSGAGGGGGAYFPSVYFAFNSATVSAANQERLATIAMAMKNNPGISMKVEGHTDSRGSEDYNKNLGRRRAEAVVKQLVQVYGIDENRFNVETEGETELLTEKRHDVNRRVDFVVK